MYLVQSLIFPINLFANQWEVFASHEYTVVGLSTDPAPLIISKKFKFRVLWS